MFNMNEAETIKTTWRAKTRNQKESLLYLFSGFSNELTTKTNSL